MNNKTGWVCSLCGRSNAPWLPYCGCQIETKSVNTQYKHVWYDKSGNKISSVEFADLVNKALNRSHTNCGDRKTDDNIT